MDALERIEKATALCGDRVNAIKPTDLGNATPCDEFDVKGLLNHLLGGLAMLTSAATTGKGAMPEGELVGSDPGAQYAEARTKFLAAAKAPGAFEKTWEMPFGAMPGQAMAGIAFFEHLTHAWDVAKATGQTPELPEDLAQEALDVVTPIDAMLRAPGVCGPKVEVADGASTTDKLVAFLGRTP